MNAPRNPPSVLELLMLLRHACMHKPKRMNFINDFDRKLLTRYTIARYRYRHSAHSHTHMLWSYTVPYMTREFLFIELDFIISAQAIRENIIAVVAHLIKKTSNQITLDSHCKLHHLLSGYEHLTRNVDIRCRFRLFVYLSACKLWAYRVIW